MAGPSSPPNKERNEQPFMEGRGRQKEASSINFKTKSVESNREMTGIPLTPIRALITAVFVFHKRGDHQGGGEKSGKLYYLTGDGVFAAVFKISSL